MINIYQIQTYFISLKIANYFYNDSISIMPSGKNWVNFVYINLAFALYIAGVFYYSQVAEIKANWPLYRCNPMYMPLADNMEENFTYCIQSMQTNFMGPITTSNICYKFLGRNAKWIHERYKQYSRNV